MTPELLFQMWTGGPLTKSFKDQILRVARYMVLSEINRHSLKTSESDGYVETKFNRATIGTFTGIRFHAVIEYDAHTVDVFFILTSSDRLLRKLEDPSLDVVIESPLPFDLSSAFPEFFPGGGDE
jgi:hypothetical protein